jgi:hypothetical protein
VAGYSGTPLARKLGIKEGDAIAIVGSRDGLHNLEGLPDLVTVRNRARGPLDVILFALPRGLVENKVCAIDDTWSGLRLVIRRENL